MRRSWMVVAAICGAWSTGCSPTGDLETRIAELERAEKQWAARIAALEEDARELRARIEEPVTPDDLESRVAVLEEAIEDADPRLATVEEALGEYQERTEVSIEALHSADSDLAGRVDALTAGDAFVPRSRTLTEGTSYTQWSYTPDGEGRGAFEMIFSGGLFNDTFDNVMSWGYNQSRRQPSEPMFVDQLESDYEVVGQPGVHWMERFWEFKTADDSVRVRPLFVQSDRDSGQTSVTLTGHGSTGPITFIPGVEGGNLQVMKIKGDAVQIYQGVPLAWSGAGPKTFMTAQNTSGAGTLSIIVLDANDRIKLGGSGVVTVDEPGFKLGFFNNNPISKPTIVGSRSDPGEALRSLLSYGALMGLWNDQTTP